MGAKRDLTGRVQGVNERGISIDGTWYNYSKFFEGERQPARGAAVTAVIGEYQGKDYLNKLTVIGSALPNSGSTPTAGSSVSGGYGFTGSRSTETDKRIARQVALKAAIDFRRESATEGDVIASARVFEKFLGESYEDASSEDAA